MLKNKSILVTGGTGSFGKGFCKTILQNYDIKKLVIFSRDELKQFEMSLDKNFKDNPKIRFFLGDVRDRLRIRRALNGIDIVIHAAALKQVPTAEYNPTEFIKTNINGAQNIIEACIDANVKKIIALSTDKAVSPANLYGATKLCSDKLFIAANNYAGNKNFRFSIVRYGNVISSRGSVIPKFKEIDKTGAKNRFPITDNDMTRFMISIEKGVETVLYAIKNQIGGEIFVPKMPSCKIVDLCKSINGKRGIKVIGIRPGEKLHEELISQHDSLNTLDIGNYYVILNNQNKSFTEKYYKKKFNAKKVKKDFSYNSKNNNYLNIKEIKKILL